MSQVFSTIVLHVFYFSFFKKNFEIGSPYVPLARNVLCRPDPYAFASWELRSKAGATIHGTTLFFETRSLYEHGAHQLARLAGRDPRFILSLSRAGIIGMHSVPNF